MGQNQYYYQFITLYMSQEKVVPIKTRQIGPKSILLSVHTLYEPRKSSTYQNASNRAKINIIISSSHFI